MVNPDPPWPPRLAGEVLGTGHLQGELVEELSYRFRTIWEYGGLLYTDRQSGRGIHYSLSHLASGFDPVPGFKWLSMLGVEHDKTVNFIHSLFDFPAGL